MRTYREPRFVSVTWSRRLSQWQIRIGSNHIVHRLDDKDWAERWALAFAKSRGLPVRFTAYEGSDYFRGVEEAVVQ